MTTRKANSRIAPAPAELVRPLIGMPADAPIGPDGPLAHIAGRPVLNVQAVIGKHPDLLVALNPVLNALGCGVLPLRDRELAVLRVGYGLHSAYEWAHHAAVGARAGLTEQEIARVPAGPDAPGWSEFDAALLRAVDELRGPRARVSDRTWAELTVRYDERQMVELLATVGAYTLLAYILNSCDVAIEDWFTDPADLPEG
ncbi:carboxymuconolactone decarboxylase family protein [Saccharothrix sp. NRRL B-16314]|uniref:carboxymuconolactone decarboxylase family protein n=1 Tax=Saccharothrix sp. NRRL B-16314 TaxID=1463825 RepID=UPI00068CF774|nr:carboxymuconolactone decarboxylase family protein [Saccharothrix sp. NRRL B-16314]